MNILVKVVPLVAFAALTAQSCSVTARDPRGPVVDGPRVVNTARQERVCRRAFATQYSVPPRRVRVVSSVQRPSGRARITLRTRRFGAVCVVSRNYRVMSLRS